MGVFKQLDIALQELIDQHGAPAVLAAATEMLKCRCAKCGNAWAPRGGKLPAQCPACKSVKWQAKRETFTDRLNAGGYDDVIARMQKGGK